MYRRIGSNIMEDFSKPMQNWNKSHSGSEQIELRSGAIVNENWSKYDSELQQI